MTVNISPTECVLYWCKTVNIYPQNVSSIDVWQSIFLIISQLFDFRMCPLLMSDSIISPQNVSSIDVWLSIFLHRMCPLLMSDNQYFYSECVIYWYLTDSLYRAIIWMEQSDILCCLALTECYIWKTFHNWGVMCCVLSGKFSSCCSSVQNWL